MFFVLCVKWCIYCELQLVHSFYFCINRLKSTGLISTCWTLNFDNWSIGLFFFFANFLPSMECRWEVIFCSNYHFKAHFPISVFEMLFSVISMIALSIKVTWLLFFFWLLFSSFLSFFMVIKIPIFFHVEILISRCLVTISLEYL